MDGFVAGTVNSHGMRGSVGRYWAFCLLTGQLEGVLISGNRLLDKQEEILAQADHDFFGHPILILPISFQLP
jgi:hypothetical protein